MIETDEKIDNLYSLVAEYEKAQNKIYHNRQMKRYYELRSMLKALMPDETDLRDLTESTIHKVEVMSREDYKNLCESWSHDDCLLHFSLGLDDESMNSMNNTEG